MIGEHKPVKQVVLCVDDNHSILELSKMALELEGYSVLTATSGPHALEKFSAESVDAVVLDYEMPGMNGAEVAIAMKHLKPNVPRLLFTACQDLPADATMVVDEFCDKLNGFEGLRSRVHCMLDTARRPHVVANPTT
jgi:CheY-like chemotaxis protein